MPSTFAQAQTSASQTLKLLNAHDLYLNATTPNVVGVVNALRGTLNGDRAESIMAVANTHRSRIAALVAPENVGRSVQPHLLELLEASNLTEKGDLAGFAANMEELRRHMVRDSESLNSREMTYGSPAAGGGNVGDGALLQWGRALLGAEDF